MKESTRRVQAMSGPSQTLLWLLLPTLVVAALILYYPAAEQNLPVALNVDDRTSLGVLLRFHQGSANPKFFMYPTLYFYLTYALTAGFGFSKILLTGHLLNLAFLGLTAWLSALFCVRQFDSIGAGLIAAYSVLLSPTLVSSGAYLCTDILLSAATILSLDLLIVYFRSRSARNWWYAMLAVGCAVASKYTAAVIFIVYAISEIVLVYRVRNDPDATKRVGFYFSRTTISSALLVSGVTCASLTAFFPSQQILHFVSLHRTNLDTRSTAEYLVFFNKLRRLSGELSVASVVLLIGAWRSESFYKAISLKRLYYGLLIIVGVFLVTTPYSLLDPTKFIYDLGALVRSNVVVVGSHQQWGGYYHWLFDVENRTLVIFGFLGLGLMVYRLGWLALTPITFVAIHVVTICTAHRGFARYLDSLLPLLYCAAALLIHEGWKLAADGTRSRSEVLLWRSAICFALLVITVQTVRNAAKNNRAAADHTAYYTAYEEVLKTASSRKQSTDANDSGQGAEQVKVLYAGFAPSIELDLAGFKTQEVSWTTLAQRPIGNLLRCDELLILNKRGAAANHLDTSGDNTLEILLDDPRGEGQIVARRLGCGKTPSPSAGAPL